jgi:hypothetical protein
MKSVWEIFWRYIDWGIFCGRRLDDKEISMGKTNTDVFHLEFQRLQTTRRSIWAGQLQWEEVIKSDFGIRINNGSAMNRCIGTADFDDIRAMNWTWVEFRPLEEKSNVADSVRTLPKNRLFSILSLSKTTTGSWKGVKRIRNVRTNWKADDRLFMPDRQPVITGQLFEILILRFLFKFWKVKWSMKFRS